MGWTHWWAAPLYQNQRNRSGLNNWLDCLASWYTPNFNLCILLKVNRICWDALPTITMVTRGFISPTRTLHPQSGVSNSTSFAFRMFAAQWAISYTGVVYLLRVDSYLTMQRYMRYFARSPSACVGAPDWTVTSTVLGYLVEIFRDLLKMFQAAVEEENNIRRRSSTAQV